MAEQKLYGSKVAGLPIDQRGLRSPEGMRSVRRRVEADRLCPALKDPRVLPRREVRQAREPARKEKIGCVVSLLR